MEKIDKAIEILQAFKKGKTLEWREIGGNIWYENKYSDDLVIDTLRKLDWRIKPQSTYRPYDNSEEFLKASKEHGPYICSCSSYLDFPIRVLNEGVELIDYTKIGKYDVNFYGYSALCRQFHWEDGTPCGVLEK